MKRHQLYHFLSIDFINIVIFIKTNKIFDFTLLWIMRSLYYMSSTLLVSPSIWNWSMVKYFINISSFINIIIKFILFMKMTLFNFLLFFNNWYIQIDNINLNSELRDDRFMGHDICVCVCLCENIILPRIYIMVRSIFIDQNFFKIFSSIKTNYLSKF